MNQQLTPPSEELALRLLAAVPYKDRLPAGRLTPRLGIMRGSLRSLPELTLYLAPDTRTLPGVNLDRLADWIEHVIGDPDFAAEIRTATRTADSHVDGCMRVHALVEYRLAQAKKIMERDTVDTPSREKS